MRRLDCEACELSEVRAVVRPPGLLCGGPLGRLAVADAPDCAPRLLSAAPIGKIYKVREMSTFITNLLR